MLADDENLVPVRLGCQPRKPGLDFSKRTVLREIPYVNQSVTRRKAGLFVVHVRNVYDLDRGK